VEQFVGTRAERKVKRRQSSTARNNAKTTSRDGGPPDSSDEGGAQISARDRPPQRRFDISVLEHEAGIDQDGRHGSLTGQRVLGKLAEHDP
jgi:hypothetical protein